MSAQNAPSAMEVIGVGKRFGGVTALNDVSLRLTAGSVCGLIGPNGAGKTTLFDVLTGVQRPTQGTILLDGRDISNRSSTWRARQGVRRTFQRQQVFGWLSVEDNVLVATEWQGGGGGVLADITGLPSRRRIERARRAEVDAVLEQLNLTADRKQIAGHLPIGKARTLELARVLVARPRIILLDEPTSGLEAVETERFGRAIDAVRDQGDCAVLLVEHDVPFVMERCDRIVVLDLGSIIAEGTPRDIRDDPQVRSAYLGDSAFAG